MRLLQLAHDACGVTVAPHFVVQPTRRYITHASFPFAHAAAAVNVEMTDEASGLYKQLRAIVGTSVRTVLAAPFYGADGQIAGVVQVCLPLLSSVSHGAAHASPPPRLLRR